MSAGGTSGRGQSMPSPQPPARENLGLDKYCIRCNTNFKTRIEKAEHDRILHRR